MAEIEMVQQRYYTPDHLMFYTNFISSLPLIIQFEIYRYLRSVDSSPLKHLSSIGQFGHISFFFYVIALSFRHYLLLPLLTFEFLQYENNAFPAGHL